MAGDGFLDNNNYAAESYDAGDENLVMDLNEVDEKKSGFEALPAGIYNAYIDEAEFGYSATANNPMITWKFKVTDEPYANRLLFYHTVLNTDMGKASLKKLIMRVCPETDMSAFNPKTFCSEGTAIGLPCRVKIKIDIYKGEKKNSVKDVLSAESEGAFLGM